jgi:hypothetical protein
MTYFWLRIWFDEKAKTTDNMQTITTAVFSENLGRPSIRRLVAAFCAISTMV